MQALLDWNPTFAKASSHYAMSAEKQEFLIEYCNFVKHMASMVTDFPVKIQPDAIIDFTTRIPVGPFFVHNVPQACPENWPFGDFFWNRLSSWARLLQWSNVESRPTAMLELYIDFELYTKTIVPLPVKPKRKNQPNANIILLIRTWNMLKLSLNFHSKVLLGTVLLLGPVTTSVLSFLVNGSRNQAPWRILGIVFGSLLLNWLHLQPPVPCRIKNYIQFLSPQWEKEKNVYAIPSLVDTQIGTCVSTLGGCIHMHSIRHLSFCIRAFDCLMVCLVVTPEFVVFCSFPTCQVRVVRFYQSALPPPHLPPPRPSSSSTSCPLPPRPPPRLLLQFLLDHVCINFHLHFRLANSSPSSLPTLFAKLFANFPAQCAPLDLNLGQPGTFPAQCAPLDLNLGPAQLSVHRWTSTWDLPSSVCTAGPQPGTCPAQCAPLDLNGQIECQKICQIECQKVCQVECQIKCQIECQKICQIECQKVCQVECQIKCQIECQKICQNICQKICQIQCQIECQKICQNICQKICQIECQIECQKICQIECQKICQ